MGLKRPFDAEQMQECNAKHARQLSYHHNQLNQLDEAIPYHVSVERTGVLVEDLSGLCEKKPTWANDANHVEKEFDKCAPFSWFPTGLCQEDSRTQPSLSHQSSGSEFTWRPLSPVEDLYSCLMNRSPRKPVPVGSNHQADIPECVFDRSEGKLMGKCVIPMPDSDSEVCGTGQGRKECLCPDKGSVRCVRQHIMEARENLIETIGYERFMELGFCEMGEEVASVLWTEDEEDLFHKVVYSNPFSLGRDFWKQLKATFPSRTMNDLVSYYFNVFILRRRATQNRYKTLDIDSDDDEWQVEYDVSHSSKSSLDEDDNNSKSSSHDDSEEEEEETNSNDDDNEECGNGDDSEEDDCGYKDKISKDGVGGEEVNVEDDSCMSFELQDSSNLIFSHNPIENRECRRSGDDGSYSFDDACDRRLASDCWTKNNDLLPTSNIIEEIFGQDEWRDDNNNLKGK